MWLKRSRKLIVSVGELMRGELSENADNRKMPDVRTGILGKEHHP